MRARSRVTAPLPVEERRRKRILIIEDHPLMRDGIVKWFSLEPDFEVCGEADSARRGLQAAEKLKPDLVLCDITLGDRSGLELLKDLKALDPDLPAIVLSMHDESVYALRAIRAGARGYVMKKAGGAEVVAAVKEVLAGGTAVSRSVTTQLLAEMSHRHRPGRPTTTALTDREFEIMRLIGTGLAVKEIAAKLHLSAKTVRTHRTNITDKLHLKSTPELIRYAIHFVDTSGSV